MMRLLQALTLLTIVTASLPHSLRHENGAHPDPPLDPRPSHDFPREHARPPDPPTDRPPPRPHPPRDFLVHWFRVVGRRPDQQLACELHTRRYVDAIPTPLRPPPAALRAHSARVQPFGAPEQLPWQLLTAPPGAARPMLVPRTPTRGPGLSMEEQFDASTTHAPALARAERRVLLRYLGAYRRPRGGEEPRSPGRTESVDWVPEPGRAGWLRPVRAPAPRPDRGGARGAGRGREMLQPGEQREGRHHMLWPPPTMVERARDVDVGRDRRRRAARPGQGAGSRGPGGGQRRNALEAISWWLPRSRERVERVPNRREHGNEGTSPREEQDRSRRRTDFSGRK